MAQQIVNGGFESSTIVNGRQVTGSQADSTKNWGFAATSGIHTAASNFNGNGGNLTAPNGGNNAAFLFAANGGHNAGSGLMSGFDLPAITQNFTCSAAGSYVLSYYACQQNTGNAALTLFARLFSADGRESSSWPFVPTQAYTQFSVPVTLRQTKYTLQIRAEPPPYSGRRGATTYQGYVSGMALIDDVSIA